MGNVSESFKRDAAVYWRVFSYVLLSLAIIRWAIMTTHCVTIYNGGRTLQCLYEPLVLPMPEEPRRSCGGYGG